MSNPPWTPLDSNPLDPPPKKKRLILSHKHPHPAPFFDKINCLPQLRPQYLLKQRELQLGQPSFRNQVCAKVNGNLANVSISFHIKVPMETNAALRLFVWRLRSSGTSLVFYSFFHVLEDANLGQEMLPKCKSFCCKT